ncbi:hypothetical protein CBM2629_B60038 [Cupriavidus taiwanensis]|nr:hypothetical protein CBM2629_B60038 [Cupriavidus taiwanensis]
MRSSTVMPEAWARVSARVRLIVMAGVLLVRPLSLLFVCFPVVQAPVARLVHGLPLCSAACCRCISQYADEKRSMLSKIQASADAARCLAKAPESPI